MKSKGTKIRTNDFWNVVGTIFWVILMLTVLISIGYGEAHNPPPTKYFMDLF